MFVAVEDPIGVTVDTHFIAFTIVSVADPAIRVVRAARREARDFSSVTHVIAFTIATVADPAIRVVFAARAEARDFSSMSRPDQTIARIHRRSKTCFIRMVDVVWSSRISVLLKTRRGN